MEGTALRHALVENMHPQPRNSAMASAVRVILNIIISTPHSPLPAVPTPVNLLPSALLSLIILSRLFPGHHFIAHAASKQQLRIDLPAVD